MRVCVWAWVGVGVWVRVRVCGLLLSLVYGFVCAGVCVAIRGTRTRQNIYHVRISSIFFVVQRTITHFYVC